MERIKNGEFYIVAGSDGENINLIDLNQYLNKGPLKHGAKISGRILIEIVNGELGNIMSVRKDEFITSLRDFESVMSSAGVQLKTE